MTPRHTQQAPSSRCAALAGMLDIPVPFELHEFCIRLATRYGRLIRLVPYDMSRTASSGFLCRTAAADYLYYEKGTSPFHQAHIVLTLAAQLLPGQGDSASFSPSLVSELGPELGRLMLGRTVLAPSTDAEAEAFAFFVLDRAGLAGQGLPATHVHRQLHPVWTVLHEAVPEISGTPQVTAAPAARWRLYRTVTGIRDAMLALRPYRDPRVAGATVAAARAAGLSAGELAAAVEAAVLAAAARARAAGRPAQLTACAATEPSWLRADLASETAWLRAISRALTAPDVAPAPHRPERGAPVPPAPTGGVTGHEAVKDQGLSP